MINMNVSAPHRQITQSVIPTSHASIIVIWEGIIPLSGASRHTILSPPPERVVLVRLYVPSSERICSYLCVCHAWQYKCVFVLNIINSSFFCIHKTYAVDTQPPVVTTILTTPSSHLLTSSPGIQPIAGGTTTTDPPPYTTNQPSTKAPGGTNNQNGKMRSLLLAMNGIKSSFIC